MANNFLINKCKYTHTYTHTICANRLYRKMCKHKTHHLSYYNKGVVVGGKGFLPYGKLISIMTFML